MVQFASCIAYRMLEKQMTLKVSNVRGLVFGRNREKHGSYRCIQPERRGSQSLCHRCAKSRLVAGGQPFGLIIRESVDLIYDVRPAQVLCGFAPCGQCSKPLAVYFVTFLRKRSGMMLLFYLRKRLRINCGCDSVAI
ncbi:MAG: hypothetical protein AB2693_25505 [Candidatus Thiodiazotropha sp.]